MRRVAQAGILAGLLAATCLMGELSAQGRGAKAAEKPWATIDLSNPGEANVFDFIGAAGTVEISLNKKNDLAVNHKVGQIRLTAKAQPTELCFPDLPAKAGDTPSERCVPWELIQVAFGGYVKGGRAPSQILIDLQAQLAQTLEQLRECQGQLGPLAAKQHVVGLQAQQSALNEAFGAACATTGRIWDATTQACVAKPADDKKTPAPPIK